jgi:hypothetical protein
MTLISSQRGSSMFPNFFPNKYVLLWRLNTIGIVAVLLITFLLPSITLPASAK